MKVENYLEVREVEKAYGEHRVLHNITFHVPKKSIVGFIGNNGAGKSTTFKAILGICQIDSGEIKLFQESIESKRTDLKENVGVVFDTLHLPEKLTIAQVDRIFSKVYRKWNQELFGDYLNCFALTRDLVVGNLSRGMSMKLSLAIALSHEAKLLLLDEATSGLDPSSRETVLDLLKTYVEENQASILMSSHIVEDVESTADKIVYLENGKIVTNQAEATCATKKGNESWGGVQQ